MTSWRICTYASRDCQDVLDGRDIVCSMSRRGNCHDNAVAEAFFSSPFHAAINSPAAFERPAAADV